ncbi:MAG: (Fe-S)-binding protein, partial [Candidatus Freyarchaeota archaeon]
MGLEEYKSQMERCSRCSLCKWVPIMQVKNWRFAQNCPSILKYNFHAYSAGGKIIAALGRLE